MSDLWVTAVERSEPPDSAELLGARRQLLTMSTSGTHTEPHTTSVHSKRLVCD